MGLAAALAAGIAGAAAWAALAYFANLEIGWLAWGIGALVGFAAAKGGRYGLEGRPVGPSVPLAVAAVLVTVLSICAGKFALIEVQVQLTVSEWIAEAEGRVAAGFSDEQLTSYLADEIGEAAHGPEWQARYNWPDGIDPSQAVSRAEYPTDLWAQADTKWQGMTPEQRAEYETNLGVTIRDNSLRGAEEFATQARREGFLSTFGAMDLLFFGLAIVTAWQVTLGGGSE